MNFLLIYNKNIARICESKHLLQQFFLLHNEFRDKTVICPYTYTSIREVVSVVVCYLLSNIVVKRLIFKQNVFS